MPICPICDDTGMLNSDSTQPRFCYCAAGKQSRRQWEASDASSSYKQGAIPRPAGFIDISDLDQVNANVDAMRASLLGSPTTGQHLSTKHPAVQLLYRIGHNGHEITMAEATQLQNLARALESFFGDISSVGRKKG